MVGTGFEVGSGYPETWDDQPFSTGYGQNNFLSPENSINQHKEYYDPNMTLHQLKTKIRFYWLYLTWILIMYKISL